MHIWVNSLLVESRILIFVFQLRTPMRVRLQLLAPFEESKVLLPLSPNISTVSELKKHVRSSLTSVLSLSTSPKDLLLEVDGFELLAGSSVGVIEGSDVVTLVDQRR